MFSPLAIRYRSYLEASDILLTFAEVSVALAGFIGITAAFRQRNSNWSAFDLSSVRFVLEVSFAALFLSVLPGIISNFSIEPALSWRISAVAMAAVLLALFFYHRWRRQRLSGKEFPPGGRVRFRVPMLAAYLVVTAAIALSGSLGIAVQGTYLLGVTMLLLAAAIEFLAFVAALQE